MLQVSSLVIRRATRTLFGPDSFRLAPKQRLGITGSNGCGKSSLFEVILGRLEADQGSITIPNDWRIAHVKQETSDSPLSALDYTIAGDEDYTKLQQKIQQADDYELAQLQAQLADLNGFTIRSRAATLLAGLGFTEAGQHKAVHTFSGGWRMRLNLAQALMCPSELLLLDEPTNHLDLNAITWLQQWLSRYNGTALIIAHDRDFLDQVCTHIAHIEHQHITLYTGNYSKAEKARAEQLQQQNKAHAKQEKQKAKLEQFIQRFKAKASKAKQAQSRVKALEKLADISPIHQNSPYQFKFFTCQRLPKQLMTLSHVDIGYPNKTILHQLHFNLLPNDRIAIVGDNGAGKSTFFKCLAGKIKPISGEISMAQHCKLGYFAQHQLEQLEAQQSAWDHLLTLNNQAEVPESEAQLKNYLASFGFKETRIFEPIAPFSGGEKTRLALALLIFQKPNVLLLDEPTNHLDMEMRMALLQAIQDFEGAVICVSHDLFFLRAISNDILLVKAGSLTRLHMDLNEYQAGLHQATSLNDSSELDSKAKSASNKKQQRQNAAQQRAALKPITSNINQIEKEMDKQQALLQHCEQQLADETMYTNEHKDQLLQLLKQKNQLEQALAELEENWLIWQEKLVVQEVCH